MGIMTTLSFLFVICLAAFAAGDASFSQALSKALSLPLSKKDAADDWQTMMNYLANCAAAMDHYRNCQIASIHYDLPSGVENDCLLVRMEMDCILTAFQTATCNGKQAAIEAAESFRQLIDEIMCVSIRGAASFVAKYFTFIMLGWVVLLIIGLRR